MAIVPDRAAAGAADRHDHEGGVESLGFRLPARRHDPDGPRERRLPDEVHAAADARLLIPMQPGARSLNVAMAAAIAVTEAGRQVAEAG